MGQRRDQEGGPKEGSGGWAKGGIRRVGQGGIGRAGQRGTRRVGQGGTWEDEPTRDKEIKERTQQRKRRTLRMIERIEDERTSKNLREIFQMAYLSIVYVCGRHQHDAAMLDH